MKPARDAFTYLTLGLLAFLFLGWLMDWPLP